MKNYYLKAASKDALWQALFEAGVAKKTYDLTDEDNIKPEGFDVTRGEFEPTGAFTYYCSEGALDEIGEIFVESGEVETVEEVGDIPIMVAIEGYHANYLGRLSPEKEALLPLIDAPATPLRKWAGDS